MRVPSISSSSVRVSPQQERSARRLAGFLQAAAELFAELGYEATTMQAIADRSKSSIGALYNYFPDKQSVAVTLHAQYSEELHNRLQLFIEDSRKLSISRFAESFIDQMVAFAQEYPAWLHLVGAPIPYRRDLAARRALRVSIADAFRAKNPSLSSDRGLLTANVAVQIIKAMMALYRESDAKSREAVAAEFRKVLATYLESVLSEREVED
jgi:AcrR family transcriptional regulator